MTKNLTSGSIPKNLLKFSLPFLLSSFLQTFYGLSDLFIAGLFCGPQSIVAISTGSQVMHMVTVIIIGFTMGTTVLVGHSWGKDDHQKIKSIITNSFVCFITIAAAITLLGVLFTEAILNCLQLPSEAFAQGNTYLKICMAGTVFITAYNIISAVYRGIGNSKTPMYFVAISGIINITLDYVFMGLLDMQSGGAACATVISQIISTILISVHAGQRLHSLALTSKESTPDRSIFNPRICRDLFKIGLPIAAQDGFIQISFLVITIIANSRGLAIAAAVGIVEKLISFMFLVPSSMLSSVSAICAQNAGAHKHDRSRSTLYYALLFCIISGTIFTIVCHIIPETILGWFCHDDKDIIFYGSQYLRSYVFDCIIAGIHFCFSGFFCAYNKSYLSFIHNVASIIFVRIPGAYLAGVLYPATLYPMGLAAPLGSLLSAVICVIAYLFIRRALTKSSVTI